MIESWLLVELWGTLASAWFKQLPTDSIFLSEPHISYFRRSNLVFKALGQLWAISPWSLEIMHFVLLSLVHFSKVNMWIMALYCLLFKKTLNFSFLFCLTCNFLSLLSSLYFLFYPVIVLVHRSYFFDFIFQQKKNRLVA